MKWLSTLLALVAAMALLAIPAAAQQPDPYGEVLPDGAVQPDDTVAPPDAVAPRPGAVDTSRGDVARPEPVRAAGGSLPVTGGELTIILLALGVALLGVGGTAVLLARRRGHTKA